MDDDKFNKAMGHFGAMGAFFAGQGPQYMAAQESQQRTGLIEEDYRRRERLAANLEDTRKMIAAANGGDIDAVRQVLRQRIASLQASGGDPSHSIASFELLNRNPQAWLQDVMVGEQMMSARLGMDSMLAAQGGPQGWESVVTGEDGRRYGISKANPAAGYQPIPSPDGFSARSGAPTVEVNMGGEDKFQEGIAKGLADRYAQITSEAESARAQNRKLNSLAGIDIETGWGTGLQARLAGVVDGVFGEGAASQYGILDKNTVAGLETYRAIAQDFANQKLNEAKGPQTEGDAQRINQTIMGLDKAQDANDFLIAVLQEENSRKIQRERFIKSYRQEHGNDMRTFEDALSAWNVRMESTPMIGTVTDKKSGLPMLYSRFVQEAKRANKGASMGEINQAWRDLNGFES
jgi:hypothetical protein